jgi:acyl-CoA thioester hydrolase
VRLALSDYPASTTFRVEYGETDGQGRVFYANYWHYVDRGRFAYWVRLGLSEEEIRRLEHGTVMAEAHCSYRAPARFYEAVSVRTRVVRLGRASLRMDFIIVNDSTDTRMAEGYTILVNVDLGTGRAVPFTPEFKAAIQALEGRPLND